MATRRKKRKTTKVCFIIAPIAEEYSEIRKRSDDVLDYIISPVIEQFNYRPLRADKISKSGMITAQIMENIEKSPLVIADLTDYNPNVFYELAIRHVNGKPYVQMIEKGKKIPFDIADTRTIYYDTHDLRAAEKNQKRASWSNKFN